MQTVSFEELTLDPGIQGAIWSHGGAQLDVNVLYFDEGQGVDEHVNPSLDVWIVVIYGSGEAFVDGRSVPLTAGTCLYIPAGARRSVRAGASLVYASAHQKRGGLMPR